MRAFGLFLVSVTLATPALADEPAAKLTAEIDRLLATDWAAKSVEPAPLATDATFLRRASLDLIGRIPTIAEVRPFLADKSPEKRQKLIDRLLASDEHAVHLASVTRVEWMPQTLGNFRLQFRGAEFEGWLEGQFQKNVRFDKIVATILNADASVGQRGMVNFGNVRNETGEKAALQAFYDVADGKPEEMAAAASRLFLGVKLECAQCHDHPFAPYSRDQFWEFAAFFGEFTPLSPVAPSFVGPLPPQYESNRLTIPNTNREVSARYFTGGEPDWSPNRTPRAELAAWLTKPDNPLFARNLANRLWAHLFGRGLIDPIDEPGEENPPSHPAVLDAIAKAVVDSNYDIRVVLKGIALSRAYQLSSEQTHPSQAEPKHFARMTVKGLTGHQIFDSLNTASEQPAAAKGEGVGSRRFAASEVQGGNRGEFVSRFPQTNRRTESATSILQSLMLMNGKYVSGLATAAQNPLLARLQKWYDSTDVQVETLFLATLGRYPTKAEAERYEAFVNTGGGTGNETQALKDVFWVLVNGTEFLLNH
jgi:hypothetical protein